MKTFSASRRVFLGIGLGALVVLGGAATGAVQTTCGPFTDVSTAICPYVLEMYYLGITAGTSPTTYSPDATMTRGQAAVFVSKAVNQSLARSSRRAALGQWWTTTPHYDIGLGVTTIGGLPEVMQSDGQDIWVADFGQNSVARLRASDGRLLETWTGADGAFGIVVAMGRVIVSGQTATGDLYMIDPSQAPGVVTPVASNLGGGVQAVTFDGFRFWTANGDGSLAIITPAATTPWSVSKVNTGFTTPTGILFDGANIWVTDVGTSSILKLDSSGAILQTVAVGAGPWFPVFDGANIWIPNHIDTSVSVVRAANGVVVATLSGNGLASPAVAGFDGQRVLVTNEDAAASRVSLWKSADLTSIGSFSLGTGIDSFGVCSDGVSFWIGLGGSGQVGRF